MNRIPTELNIALENFFRAAKAWQGVVERDVYRVEQELSEAAQRVSQGHHLITNFYQDDTGGFWKITDPSGYIVKMARSGLMPSFHYTPLDKKVYFIKDHGDIKEPGILFMLNLTNRKEPVNLVKRSDFHISEEWVWEIPENDTGYTDRFPEKVHSQYTQRRDRDVEGVRFVDSLLEREDEVREWFRHERELQDIGTAWDRFLRRFSMNILTQETLDMRYLQRALESALREYLVLVEDQPRPKLPAKPVFDEWYGIRRA